MNKWIKNTGDCLVPILLLAPVFYSLGDTQLQSKWVLTIISVMYAFCWLFVVPKYGASLAALLFYISAQSAWTWLWVDNRHLGINYYDQVHIRFFSADSIAKIALVCLPIMVIIKDRAGTLACGSIMIYLTSIINFGFIAYEFFSPATSHCSVLNTCGGIMRNPSMNACLMACFIPIISALTGRKTAIAFMLWCLGYSLLIRSNMGIGMTVMAMGMMASIRFGVLKSLAVTIIVAVPGYWLAAAQMQNKFLSTSGRLYMWEKFMRSFAFNKDFDPMLNNIIPGMGLGTFGIFSHAIQRATQNDMPHWWTWMHNDWLELIFNTGVIGFLLALVVYCVALRRAFILGLKEVGCAIVLFGVYMAGNYPLHLAISSVFGAWLLASVLLRSEEEMLLQT